MCHLKASRSAFLSFDVRQKQVKVTGKEEIFAFQANFAFFAAFYPLTE
jgi:hypothetical protein